MQLPLNPAEIQKYQYFEYTLPATKSSTNPTWDVTYGFPGAYFNLNSYLVVELWKQDQSTTDEVFVGGNQWTVSDMEKLPENFNQQILNVNDQSVGVFTMFWNNPNKQ